MGTLDRTKTITIDEEKAYKLLLRKIPKDKYSRIVTVGRGGLGVAQRVAYKLDISEVDIIPWFEIGTLSPEDLFVDDIVCSGDTISSIPRHTDVACLVHRKSALYKPTYSGFVYEGDEYIKFSWEL